MYIRNKSIQLFIMFLIILNSNIINLGKSLSLDSSYYTITDIDDPYDVGTTPRFDTHIEKMDDSSISLLSDHVLKNTVGYTGLVMNLWDSSNFNLTYNDFSETYAHSDRYPEREFGKELTYNDFLSKTELYKSVLVRDRLLHHNCFYFQSRYSCIDINPGPYNDKWGSGEPLSSGVIDFWLYLPPDTQKQTMYIECVSITNNPFLTIMINSNTLYEYSRITEKWQTLNKINQGWRTFSIKWSLDGNGRGTAKVSIAGYDYYFTLGNNAELVTLLKCLRVYAISMPFVDGFYVDGINVNTDSNYFPERFLKLQADSISKFSLDKTKNYNLYFTYSEEGANPQISNFYHLETDYISPTPTTTETTETSSTTSTTTTTSPISKIPGYGTSYLICGLVLGVFCIMWINRKKIQKI